MKRVLFVIPYLDSGGAERALSNITTHFPEEWDINILVNSDKFIDFPFKGEIISLGIDEKPKTGSILFQLKAFIKRVIALRRLKKQGNYSACISFLDSANVANILAGRFQCRTIVSVRNSLQQQSKLPQYKYIVNPLVRLLYNRADKIVAVSRGVGEELENIFHLRKSKITVIENGYDLCLLNEQAKQALTEREEELFQKRKVIVTVGRLSEQKAQWHLLRAFTKVIRQFPDAFLVIIGKGSMENELKNMAEKYGIAEQVYFVGYSDNPYKYVSRAEFFVLPSMYEGFPNALAEAVCLGKACIATDFRTGAREILAPQMNLSGEKLEQITEAEYGILTPVCSGRKYPLSLEVLEEAENLLADAMLMLLRNPDKLQEYAEKSKLRSRILDIDNVVKKWLGVIDA